MTRVLLSKPTHSEALGFGFRCGFLGLLHMEIVQERLEREGGVEVVQTAPTVGYEVALTDRRDSMEIHNPADLPDHVHRRGNPRTDRPH